MFEVGQLEKKRQALLGEIMRLERQHSGRVHRKAISDWAGRKLRPCVANMVMSKSRVFRLAYCRDQLLDEEEISQLDNHLEDYEKLLQAYCEQNALTQSVDILPERNNGRDINSPVLVYSA